MNYKIKRTSTVFVMLTGKGEKPFLRYDVDKETGVMRILETYVPPHLRGKGLAEALVEEAIRYARENNYVVEPVCSYAFYYFLKHREKRGILAEWLRNKTDEELERMFEYRRSLELSGKK